MESESVWWHDRQPGGGHRHAFRVRTLERATTKRGHQVEVLTNDHLGRLLAVNGRVRWVESDPTYAEMAVHPVLLGRRREKVRALVIGGDDGALTAELLRHDAVERVVVLPSDPEIATIAARSLPSAAALADPRVTVLSTALGDTPASDTERFDVVILDLFADGAALSFDPRPFASADATFVTAGSLVIARERPGAVDLRTLAPAWAGSLASPERYVLPTPTCPGGFVAYHLHGRTKTSDHREPVAERRFRHYHPAIHRAAFAVPTWWKDGVAPFLPAVTDETRPVESWWHEHTEGTGISQAIDLRPVTTVESPFQKIELFEHQVFGPVLALDETIQGSAADEVIYHELAVHVPLLGGTRPRKRVLIVGGGDGGAAREVLRHPEVEELVMVEIDPDVISLSNQYFGIQAREDPRFRTLVMDAAVYVQEAVARGEQFDAVIIDATDSTEPSKSLWNDTFFRNLVTLLADDGVVVDSDILVSGLEGGLLSRDRPGEPLAVIGRAKRFFGHLEGYVSRVPLYPGGYFVFFLYTKDGRSHAVPRGAHTGKFYNAELHRGVFALPAWYETMLEKL